MNRKLEQEQIEKVLRSLEGNILIVEDKKDSEALERLGMQNILRVNSRPLVKVADDVVFLVEKHKKREVINTHRL